MDDLTLLELGPYTSLVTNIKFGPWGESIIIDCVYNVDERLPYSFIFLDCQEIHIFLHSPENIADLEDNLIDFILGKDNYREKAIIYTGILELDITYGSFKLDKKW